MSLNVPQLKPDVFIPLIVLLSYTPSAAPASAADNEHRHLQHLFARDSSFWIKCLSSTLQGVTSIQQFFRNLSEIV